MEGLIEKKIETKANYYRIAPKDDFDLGHIFGISTYGKLNPPSWEASNPSPPCSNPSTHLGTKNSMEDMEDSNTKNSFKEKKDSIYRESFAKRPP